MSNGKVLIPIFTANAVLFPSDPEAKQFGDHWFSVEE